MKLSARYYCWEDACLVEGLTEDSSGLGLDQPRCQAELETTAGAKIGTLVVKAQRLV